MDRAGLSREPERLHCLDALRGVAACAVAFGYHATLLFDETWYVATAPAPLAWLREWGWTFVDLFFVLSGFVLSHVYAASGRLQQAHGLRNFGVARVARLYPLHLTTFLFCAFAFHAGPNNTPIAALSHLAMVQALFEPVGHTFNGPSWSISVEMFCYLAFAAAVLAGQRALAVVTSIAIATGVVIVASVDTAESGLLVETAMGRGFLGFFSGVLLWTARERAKLVPTWSLLLIGAAGLGLHFASPSPLLPLTVVAWPAALLLAMRLPWFEWRPTQWLGTRSYAIYLVHLAVFNLVFSRTDKLVPSPLAALAIWVALVATVLVVADFAYRTIEIPWRAKLRARFTCIPPAGTGLAPSLQG